MELQYNNHVHSATCQVLFLPDTSQLLQMGFEPGQCRSHLESINEFKDKMKEALDKAKAALTKSKGNLARYYDQKHTLALNYQLRDKVYLDASDIQTTQPSKKLSHHCLGPFKIVKKVGNGAYHLKLFQSMNCLHLVFNIVKLTPALPNPIPGHHLRPPPPLEIIDREEEWVVEEILDSKVINQKLQYLVKWKGFGIEYNSWKPWDSVHAPDLIVEFYQKHPGAACKVRVIDFSAIPFCVVPSCHSLEGGCMSGVTHFLIHLPTLFLKDVHNHLQTSPNISKNSIEVSFTPCYSFYFPSSTFQYLHQTDLEFNGLYQ